jgi:hypothetical protein
MARQIVVEVYEYEADTPEAAEKEMTEAHAHYDSPCVVYAASTLDDLPHPSQIPAVREHFGS